MVMLPLIKRHPDPERRTEMSQGAKDEMERIIQAVRLERTAISASERLRSRLSAIAYRIVLVAVLAALAFVAWKLYETVGAVG